jgi:allophanate hydrolase subunit 2
VTTPSPSSAPARGRAGTSRSVAFTKVLGPACVQDLGRPGQLAKGLPHGGSLAPSRLRALNASLGNAPHAAGLELFGAVTFEVSLPTRVAVDGERPFLAEAGVPHTVATGGRRLRVVAFEGGFDVPEVLGGRGLLPSARLGGLEGRWLRAGDTIALGAAGEPVLHHGGSLHAHAGDAHEPLPEAPLADLEVPLFRGPEVAALSSLEALFAARFRLAATSDRAGLRLEGPPLLLAPRPAGTPSLPLLPGAMQVPPNGLPVILGPDHPVTGGYPVVGVVARASLEPLFVAPLGSAVRFVLSG